MSVFSITANYVGRLPFGIWSDELGWIVKMIRTIKFKWLSFPLIWCCDPWIVVMKFMVMKFMVPNEMKVFNKPWEFDFSSTYQWTLNLLAESQNIDLIISAYKMTWNGIPCIREIMQTTSWKGDQSTKREEWKPVARLQGFKLLGQKEY